MWLSWDLIYILVHFLDTSCYFPEKLQLKCRALKQWPFKSQLNYINLLFFISYETVTDMHETVTKKMWVCIFKFHRFWYLNLFRQLCISSFLAVSLLEMLYVRFLYAVVLSVKRNPPSWRNATFVITNRIRARKRRSLQCCVIFLLILGLFNYSFSTAYFVKRRYLNELSVFVSNIPVSLILSILPKTVQWQQSM